MELPSSSTTTHVLFYPRLVWVYFPAFILGGEEIVRYFSPAFPLQKLICMKKHAWAYVHVRRNYQSWNSVLDFTQGLHSRMSRSQPALASLTAAGIFWWMCHRYNSKEARQGQAPHGPGTTCTVSNALSSTARRNKGLSSATLSWNFRSVFASLNRRQFFFVSASARGLCLDEDALFPQTQPTAHQRN